MRWTPLCLTFLLGCPKPAEKPVDTPVTAPTQQVEDDRPAVPDLSGGAPEIDPRTLAVEMCSDDDKDGFSVEAARIDGDTLVATLRYGGGCEEHIFKACWDGQIAESMPTQTTLRVIHDGNADRCRALKTTTLSIDLTAMQDAKPTIIGFHGQTVQYGQ